MFQIVFPLYFCDFLSFLYEYKKDQFIIRNLIKALILPIVTKKNRFSLLILILD